MIRNGLPIATIVAFGSQALSIHAHLDPWMWNLHEIVMAALFPSQGAAGVTVKGSFSNKLNKQMSPGQMAIGAVEVATGVRMSPHTQCPGRVGTQLDCPLQSHFF